MKKVLFLLCIAAAVGLGAFGLFVYRKAAPSSADHRLLTLVSGDERVTSVVLNLRLLKSARSMESLKGRLDSAEKYLLAAGDIPPRHRDLFVETFSSVASGSMKTAEGVSPFQVFASHGPADEALAALKAARLIEAATGEDYFLIHPETCDRDGPLRLVQAERLLAFVPPALAEGVAARLAQAPGQQMDSLLIGKAGIHVRPYLEAQAPQLIRMAAEQVEFDEQLRNLDVSLRADTRGGLWAELDIATDQSKQIQEFWERRTRGDAPVRAAVREAVKLTPGKEGLRFTFDVNALQQHTEAIAQEVYPIQSRPLTEEDLSAITEEEVLEAADVFSYDEALTPESFLSSSGEDCAASDGVPLGAEKKLSLAFESLSAHPKLPGVDFIRLTAHACLPPRYVPLLGERELLDVAIQRPERDRHSCGPLAAEEDALSSTETIDSSEYSNRHEARNEVEFALKPGVDTQTLTAIEGSVTVHVPTRARKLQLDFRPPYGRTELPLPEGRLYVEGTETRTDGLELKLVGEGAHPTVLAVRVLNAEGKYLKTRARRSYGGGGLFELPFQKLLPQSRDASIIAFGKPARLEVVLVEASTPLTRPFTLKPPFPASEDSEVEDTEEEPRPVVAFDQATYETTVLAPGRVAELEEEFTEHLERNRDDQVGSGLRTDSPFKVALQTKGTFKGDLVILWLEDIDAGLKQLDTPLELEIQEVDFVEGTRLRPQDIEAFEEVASEKRYVWENASGGPATWRKKLSLRRTNGGSYAFSLILFDDYLPARMEDIPVARVKGQLSFSLPESVELSSPAQVSLHARVELGEGRYRITSIQQEHVSIVSENTDPAGVSALFTDAAGWPLDTSLSKQTKLEDGSFRLDFDTRGPVRQWRLLRARGGTKTYTYPFEVVAHELKSTAKLAKKRGAMKRASDAAASSVTR